MTADFDSRTIGGSFHDWEFQDAGDSGFSAVDDVETVFENGSITGSRLSADLRGQGGGSTFTGTMEGQFFGPGAAEVGGVISGTNAAQVVEGWFGGTKQ